MNEIYIHYGHKHFDKNLFQEIKNRDFVKPHRWIMGIK